MQITRIRKKQNIHAASQAPSDLTRLEGPVQDTSRERVKQNCLRFSLCEKYLFGGILYLLKSIERLKSSKKINQIKTQMRQLLTVDRQKNEQEKTYDSNSDDYYYYFFIQQRTKLLEQFLAFKGKDILCSASSC